ncbi:MAG: hypothetical protein M1608_03800, partial [Candidatus Omnitrophica bacterium]|nr:hypothetical protein [Candidatus Omnitrophota bacterium]
MRLNIVTLIGAALCLEISVAGANPVRVDDAYVAASDDAQTWTIGTDAIEVTLSRQDNRFRLISLKNKLAQPSTEYVDTTSALMPFSLDPPFDSSPFEIKSIWEKFLPNAATADPGADNLRLEVQKGDMIGFDVGPHGDYSGDQTEWTMTVDYGDGESYVSSGDASLKQGPVWFYYLHPPGTDGLIPIDSIEWIENAKEKVRIPAPASPLRSPGNAPHVGATMFHPANDLDVVRVWKAPRNGTVAIHGRAGHVRGFGDVDLSVLQIRPRTAGVKPPRSENSWTVISAESRQVESGGRPAVQLDVALTRDSIRAVYHLLAFPRTSILRQWVDLVNTGSSGTRVGSPSALTLSLRGGDAPLLHHWMIGGNSLPDEGMLHTATVTNSYHWQIVGHKTDNYTPWMSLERKDGQRDGWFFVQDYLGSWRFTVDQDETGPIRVAAAVVATGGPKLEPGEKVSLPLITLGVFRDSLEDMGERVYNWQYEYLWDYTHDDWYGLMPIANPWYNDVHNLQENFAGRLGDLDFNVIDDMRATGMELLWDDAGWSENPNIWTPSREGPDFLNTQRYLAKAGMRWLLWFCGEPTGGLMDTKVGSWGDFQWRTDGQPGFSFEMDASWRHKITRFLKFHPRSSFHTCSGGSRYAHCFEPQRFADINMFTDPGGGDQSNYYLSYLETPDKWMDVVPSLITNGKYIPDTARQLLTMVPAWDRRKGTPDDLEHLRRICDLYRYLTQQQVAGRWVYLLHPAVKGDSEFYYSQRINYDHTKACIVLKHRAPGRIVIYPKELLPELKYTLGFDSMQMTANRTGQDLMEQGIVIEQQAPGELVYLNLPNRPGSGTDTEPPLAPWS